MRNHVRPRLGPLIAPLAVTAISATAAVHCVHELEFRLVIYPPIYHIPHHHV